MNVISLFDGMSCLQIALKELGIIPEKYYASEIDKYAIKQTQLNFPDTIQLGSVTEWRTWDIDWSTISLIGAGSPCQGFSFAGKQLAFDDPGSKLFFEFVTILNHCKKFNPNVKFLLENVDMKKDHLRIISEFVGVFPVNLNSNLVSAQNRSRWYWSNIKTKKVGLFDEVYTDIPQPKDQGILLKNILEDEVDEKYFIHNPKFGFEGMDINGKGNNLRIGASNSQDKKHNFDLISVLNDNGVLRETKKANCIDANYWKGMDNHAQRSMIVAMRGRNPENPNDRRTGSPTEQRLEPNTTGKTNCLTSVQKDNLVMMQIPHGFNKGGEVAKDGKAPPMTKSSWEQNNLLITDNYIQWDGVGFNQDNRAYFEDGKSGAIDVKANRQKYLTQSRIRRLTPKECQRLQTVPEWYKWEGMSDTRIYAALGNGWTVKVIQHILSFLNYKC